MGIRILEIARQDRAGRTHQRPSELGRVDQAVEYQILRFADAEAVARLGPWCRDGAVYGLADRQRRGAVDHVNYAETERLGR